jgi:indolepyruvate ferredoxin oxidoreductase
VTLQGATVKKAGAAEFGLPEMPEPALPAIRGTWNVLITGVGGTGVVTIGAVLAQAAQIEGLGAGMMEMAGLAQKGGAVSIHLRLANRPEDISAIRVAVGEADAVIGGDLVVTGGAKTLGLMTTVRTGAVVNAHEIITGAFTRDREFRLPSEGLRLSLEARLRERVRFLDATELARRLMGDSIYSNMLILGAAWQQGLLPVSAAAIRQAIELNGAAVKGNLRAFELGRWAVLHPEEATAASEERPANPLTLQEKIDFRAGHLAAYQDEAYAGRYRRLVAAAPEELREAVAEGYHKLLAYKDEYEVARLHLATAEKARAEFDGDFRMTVHLAPPFLAKAGPNGRPAKREFGPWMFRAFRLLAAMKGLRGTAFDPFGRGAERRMERALIAEYEADMAEILPKVTPATRDAAVALARLPLDIRGFGPVKEASQARAAKQREELLAVIRAGGAPVQAAAE